LWETVELDDLLALSFYPQSHPKLIFGNR
jgi:hypothetical protein